MEILSQRTLEHKSIHELREIASANNIEVLGNRSYKASYIESILRWQSETLRCANAGKKEVEVALDLLVKDLKVASWVAAHDRCRWDDPVDVSHTERHCDVVWIYFTEGGATVISLWDYDQYWQSQQERHPELRDYQPAPMSLPAVKIETQKLSGSTLSGTASCNGCKFPYTAVVSETEPPIVDCGDEDRTRRLRLQWRDLRCNQFGLYWLWDTPVSFASRPPAVGFLHFPRWNVDGNAAAIARLHNDSVAIGSIVWTSQKGGYRTDEDTWFHATSTDPDIEATMPYRPLPTDWTVEHEF